MAFRTQKISQMTPKGADLEATDLIEVSTIESGSYVTRSITGQELIDAIPAPTGFVPTSRTLTINGVTQDLSADRTFTIATGLTVGTTPIASGTNGRVLFQGTGNVLQQSSSLFWDNANERLGVGTSTPAQTFQVYRNTSAGYLASFNSGATLNTNASLTVRIENANLPSLQALNPGAGAFNTFALNPLGGNILIGTTTDAGFRLDVNGTARVQGNATIVGTSLSSFSVSNGATAMIQTASSGIGSSDFRLRLFNNGNTQTLDLYGSGDYDHQSKHAFRTNGTERMRIFSTGNVLINTTTDAGFRLDVNGDTRLGSGTTTGTTEVRGSNIVIFRVNDVLNNNNMGIYKNATSGYLFESSSANQLSYGYASNYWMSWRNSTKSIAIASTGSEPTPAATAIFDLQSTTKGFLPPRMTTTQKNAIASPATGLQVYDTTLNQMSYYNGTTWTNI
jgi:hypothetical protein